jgi:hypothetical protein
MPLSKKAQEKSLTSIEQSLMAGPNCHAGRGKMVQPQVWVSSGFYGRGESKEVSACAVVSGRVGAVLEHRNLRVGVPVWLIHKMATLLFYHSPIFSLIMMRVGAEDQELG